MRLIIGYVLLFIHCVMYAAVPIERAGLEPEEIIERPLDEFRRDIKTVEDLDIVQQRLSQEIQEAEDQNDLVRAADLGSKEAALQEEMKNRAVEAPPKKPEEGQKGITIPVEKPVEPGAVSSGQVQREQKLAEQWSLLPKPTSASSLRERANLAKNTVEKLQKGQLPDGTSVSLSPYEKARLISIVSDAFDKASAQEGTLSAAAIDLFASEMRSVGRWALARVPGSSWLPGIEKPWEVVRDEGLGGLKEPLRKAINDGLANLSDDPRIREQQLRDYWSFVIDFALDDDTRSLLQDINLRLSRLKFTLANAMSLDQAKAVWSDVLTEDPARRLIIGAGQRGSIRKRLALKTEGLTARDNDFLAQIDRDMEQAARDFITYMKNRIDTLSRSAGSGMKKYEELQGFGRILDDLIANIDNFSTKEKAILDQLKLYVPDVAKLRLDIMLDPDVFVSNWRPWDGNVPSLFAESYYSIVTNYDYQRAVSPNDRVRLLQQQQARLDRLLKAASRPEVAQVIATSEPDLYKRASLRYDEIRQFLADPPKPTNLVLDKEYKLYQMIPQDQLTFLQKLYLRVEQGTAEDFMATLKNMRDILDSKTYQKNIMLYDQGRSLTTLVTTMIAFNDPEVMQQLISWARDSQLKAALQKLADIGEDAQKQRDQLKAYLKAQAGLGGFDESLAEKMVNTVASVAAHALFSLGMTLKITSGSLGTFSVVALVPSMGGVEQATRLAAYSGIAYLGARVVDYLGQKLSTLEINKLEQLIESGKPMTITERISYIVDKARQAGITFKDKVGTFLSNWITSLRYGANSLNARLSKATSVFSDARSRYLRYLDLDPQKDPSSATLRLAIERKKREIASMDPQKQAAAQKQLDALGQQFVSSQQQYAETYQEYISLIFKKIAELKQYIDDNQSLPQQFGNMQEVVDWTNKSITFLADINNGIVALGPDVAAALQGTPLESLAGNVTDLLQNVTSLYQQDIVNTLDKSIDDVIKQISS